MQKLLISLVLLFVIGCDKPVVENWSPKNPIDSQVIAEAGSNVAKDDLEVMYKQFRGLALYLENCDNCIQNTAQIEKITSKFKSDYKYSGDNELSSAVTEFLLKNGYEDVKIIVSSVDDEKLQISKSEIIEDMNTIADGVRLALESKKDVTR